MKLTFLLLPSSLLTRKMRRFTVSVFLGVTFTQPAISQTNNLGTVPWRVICEAENRNAKAPLDGCRMSQTLATNETLKPVLTARVFPGKSPTLLLTLPLKVFLKPGLRLTVDKGTPVTYAFEICDNDGCHAGIQLKNQLLSSLKRGEFARFAFQDGTGIEIVLPVSLEGFTKSWGELNELYAK